MKQILKLFSISILFLLVIITGCTKEEGEGGTSTIMGKVYAYDYNEELTNKLDEYYIGGEDVYIVYGDNDVYNDDFETHYDGTYKFEYLRMGTYYIYTYSKDTTGGKAPIVVMDTVEITGKDMLILVDDLVIVK